jgi:hypothetical protein
VAAAARRRRGLISRLPDTLDGAELRGPIDTDFKKLVGGRVKIYLETVSTGILPFVWRHRVAVEIVPLGFC